MDRGRSIRLAVLSAFVLLAISQIAGAGTVRASAGTFKQFPVPTKNGFPSSITTGPDGALWFVEDGKIGRISPTGNNQVTEFSMPGGRTAASITSGPDDALWFTEPSTGLLGRATTAGVITEFTPPGNPGPNGNLNQPTIDRPQSITRGPDGALWFTETIFSNACVCVTGGKIGRSTVSGTINEFTLPTGATRRTASNPAGIATGPDGALWFADSNLGKIGRITTNGSVSQFTVPQGAPAAITQGPDGAMWFTANYTPAGRIGRITMQGSVNEFTVPAGPNGVTITASIVAGADGNLWTSTWDPSSSTGAILRVTPSGSFTSFPLSTNNEIDGVTAGPNTQVWFTTSNTQTGAAQVGEVSTS